MTSPTEVLTPGDGIPLSQDEFTRSAGITQTQLQELLDYGLVPGGKLDLAAALALREAMRLHGAFDLDLFSTGLLAGYIEKIRELQIELRQLRAERSGLSVHTEVSYTSIEVRSGG